MRNYYFMGLVHGLPLAYADKMLYIDNSADDDYLLKGERAGIMS